MNTEQSGTAVAQLPRTPKGRATRARVLRVAADLMYERGAAATSIDDVKREANVSASQVGHYFGDKRSLVRAVIGYQTEAVLEGQRPLLDQLDSFEALRKWCDLNIALLDANACVGGCAIGSLAAELADTDPDLRADLAQGFERWREPIRAGLASMKNRGELREEADPEKLATALLAGLEGGTLLSQTTRSSAPLAATLDSLLDYIRLLAR
ncbi:TetR/AcrR family transcriptional regulator [Herbiconiux sp. P17]|uniref:TetR/AcrR family transcriptional regulator n=1 Tax=Herbiconiux wuyangfengii TaxID=3342794 RepID=UPI0035B7D34A